METRSVAEPGNAVWALLNHARPHRRMLLAVLLLTLGSSAANLAQPLVAQDILRDLENDAPFTGPLTVLALLLVVSAALTGITIWLNNRTAEGVVLHLRRNLIHRLLRLRVHHTDQASAGDLNTRVTADTTVLQQAASTGLVQVLDGVLSMVAAGALMAFLDWRLFLATLLVLLGVLLVGAVVVPRITAASRAVQEEVGQLGATMERALGAARLVKANAAEGVETDRANSAAQAAYRAGVRGGKYSAVIGILSGSAIQVSFLLVLGVGGAMVAAGSLHVATLIAFLLYLFRMMGPVIALVSGVSTVSQGLGAMSRIEEVRAMQIEEDVDVVDVINASRPPEVRLVDLAFSYPDREFALDGVSFTAEAGRCTAIVGPSGAGKTTVFALLERFYEPASGRIELDGTDIAAMTRAQLRHRVAYVEQDVMMLAGTLRHNLTYGSPGVSEADIATALDATRLSAFVAGLPAGLDTQVGSRGSMLSGGQRQRIAIARALLRHPDVLLLDEITAQLDAQNEEALRQAVHAASERCTVLMIAHRLSTVVSADRIIVMDGGRLRATGRHADLLRSNDLYRELASTQLLVPADPTGPASGAPTLAVTGRPVR